jgi:hypothetical protein
MQVPTRDDLTTTVRLVVNWLALSVPDDGYSPIQSYNLQWDSGTSANGNLVWSDLIGYETDFLDTTF